MGQLCGSSSKSSQQVSQKIIGRVTGCLCYFSWLFNNAPYLPQIDSNECFLNTQEHHFRPVQPPLGDEVTTNDFTGLFDTFPVYSNDPWLLGLSR